MGLMCFEKYNTVIHRLRDNPTANQVWLIISKNVVDFLAGLQWKLDISLCDKSFSKKTTEIFNLN